MWLKWWKSIHLFFTFLQKYVCPVLKSLRSPTDTVEEYVSHYGYFGQLLYEGVQKERQVSLSQQMQAQQRPSLQIPQVGP